MTNNIQKVIEDGLKGVDLLENLKMQVESWDCDADCYVDREKIKAYLSTIISNVLQAIEAEVEGKKRPICRCLCEKTKLGSEYNKALSEVLTLLKSARESIK